jgi:hypothetical protein
VKTAPKKVAAAKTTFLSEIDTAFGRLGSVDILTKVSERQGEYN